MNMEDKILKSSDADEIKDLRGLLSQGLFLLELEYPERLGILLALKTKEQILEMLWWIRQNLERKPSQREIMDIFQNIIEYNYKYHCDY